MTLTDFRYAARALRARPALTAVAVLSLALGIGANVAIFTVVNAVLFRPLPFAEADRIIQLANAESASTLSGPELVDITRDSRTLASVGAYAFADGNVTAGRQDAERVRIARVSAGFFEVLRPQLFAGRPFAAGEDQPGAAPVVVISRGLATRYFGDASAAPGQRILINDQPRTVTGVMPAGFEYPATAVDVWSPLQLDPANAGERRNHSYRLIGRLAPTASIQTAQAEIDAFKAGWQKQYPDLYPPQRPFVTTVLSMPDRVLGATKPYLAAMLGAVALVLLIACVNVASLLLAYGESRRRELAICVAMGASRGKLAMRSISESLLLAAGGGVVGVALAWPAYRALVAAAPDSIPRLSMVALDPRVLGFALFVSVLTALVSGLTPLVRTFRDTESAMLRTAGRSGDPGGGPSTQRTQALLVMCEVTLAVTLLGGAGLLTRSLINLRQTDLGFEPAGVLTARISLPRPAYDDARGAAAVQTIVDRLHATPSVIQAAAMAWTPMIDGGGMWSVEGEGSVRASGPDEPLSAPQQVTSGFFRTMGIPLLRGRDIAPTDIATSDLVAIVNERFGHMLWGAGDPLGRRFRVASKDAKWVTIIGVVPDTRVDGITEAKPPVMYFPHAQATAGAYFTSLNMTLAVRYAGDAAPMAAAIRSIVRETDPRVPVSDIRSLSDVVGSTIARERFTGLLVGGFAFLAAVLAGVGIYGVIAYGVVQRRFEIGVRMALGAPRRRILASIARRGLTAAAVGLVLGLTGAVGVGRLMHSVLFGVRAFDPEVLAVVAAMFVVVIVAALIVPSRRAMSVSPTETLRVK